MKRIEEEQRRREKLEEERRQREEEALKLAEDEEKRKELEEAQRYGVVNTCWNRNAFGIIVQWDQCRLHVFIIFLFFHRDVYE